MKTFKEKIHMLADLIERYVSEVYIPQYCSTPEDIVCNYLTTAIVISWNENIQLFCCYVDDDEIEEDDSPLDVDWFLEFFTKSDRHHNLRDCAALYQNFRHPEAYDIFGFTASVFDDYGPLAALAAAMREIKTI